ncbi:hypothetical protein WBJ53_29635 [Spirosoma sp. SC4-14]|uniref:hypothetical protein n=1 Tax=Spirosoma sp. SC4-14 TaxID=3128900 RepID=UPI0030CCA220
MKHQADVLFKELEHFRTKATDLIEKLYRENVKDHKGNVLAEVLLTEEWEWEGQVFNALTRQGLAYIVDERLIDQFIWKDLDAESLVEVIRILEDKEFD